MKVPHLASARCEYGVCSHCKAMYRTLLATCGSAEMIANKRICFEPRVQRSAVDAIFTVIAIAVVIVVTAVIAIAVVIVVAAVIAIAVVIAILQAVELPPP